MFQLPRVLDSIEITVCETRTPPFYSCFDLQNCERSKERHVRLDRTDELDRIFIPSTMATPSFHSTLQITFHALRSHRSIAKPSLFVQSERIINLLLLYTFTNVRSSFFSKSFIDISVHFRRAFFKEEK